MVSLTNPRVSSAIAVIILSIYVLVIYLEIPAIQDNQTIQLLILLTIGTFIFIAAFNFAANEIKKTEGVIYAFDLPFRKLFGIFLFAVLIAVGYNILLVIMLEVGKVTLQSQGKTYSKTLMLGLAVFMLIYPLFQYYFLALPGEDSSIPSEFVLERILESMRGFFKSPLLTAIVAYFLSYGLPFILLFLYLENFELTMLLIAIILPMISLGALAGAGIGEDLIRMRLMKNPFKDWTKLGWPKINIRQLKFEVGGLFLVLFAIQAIITTAIFGITSILSAFDLYSLAAGTGIYTLFLTLFNKGRGATKEMTEVWTEGGFKVNIFQLFLPVYVFFGVVMSSALEAFVGQPDLVKVLDELKLSEHRALTTFVLIIQNFVLIFTAILILKNPPGTAERRLIKEVPEFYHEDPKGYDYIYGKLKSDRSVENLLREINKIIKRDISKADDFLDIITNSLDSRNSRVQIAASEVLMNVTKRLKKHDDRYYNLVIISLNSQHAGSRIFAVRAMNNLIGLLDGEHKETAIRTFAEKLEDDDPVVSWDTGLSLQKIITNEPEYRGFVLALLIKTLISTKHESTLNSINRFLNKVARDSTEVGQMAMNILSIQLSSGKSENINNILLGIKSLLRADSYLAQDLLESVTIGVGNPDPDIRKDYYLVLSHLAQYGSGQETDVLNFIMNGLSDESEGIQRIAYDALAKNVANHPGLIDDTFMIIQGKYNSLQPKSKIGSLSVLEAISKYSTSLHASILDLIQESTKDPEASVRAATFSVFAVIADLSPKLAERIYHLSVDNLTHSDDNVRIKAITAVGIGVKGNPTLAKGVFRRISSARNDNSTRVQLAAIEALGYVASSSRDLSDTIYEELTPLLHDDDWQVRSASIHALYSSALNRSEVREKLLNSLLITLLDEDRTVRAESLDILNFLLEKHRPTAETVLNFIKKEMKNKNMPDENRIMVYNSLSLIATHRLRLVNQILLLLTKDFENEDNPVRIALYEALKNCLDKIASSREPSQDLQKTLDNVFSRILKAANHSLASIRRDAYNSITEICIALPNFKIAKRGRNAIDTAIKQEKDVGLQEHLETCRVRAKPPLDF